jgi:ribonuclease HII
LAGVRDSKQMPPFDREKAAGVIWRLAHSIGIGFVGPRIIEEIGIVAATRQAMVNAVSFLRPQPDYAIIDYLNLPELTFPNHGITYGDTLCLTIAAASVVAKVARDNLMREQECCYPGYGFFNNKGYCTAEHLGALERLGPCPIHRRNFSPVAQHSMFRGLDATPKG